MSNQALVFIEMAHRCASFFARSIASSVGFLERIGGTVWPPMNFDRDATEYPVATAISALDNPDVLISWIKADRNSSGVM